MTMLAQHMTLWEKEYFYIIMLILGGCIHALESTAWTEIEVEAQKRFLHFDYYDVL